MSCKKCGSLRKVILRKRDYYCDVCFINSTNHKFRACLGKSKLLAPNESILICSSGGVGSIVLLDLIHCGMSVDNTKKLRIVPFVLHIIDNDRRDAAEMVLEQCKQYSFNVYFIHVSAYLNDMHQLPKVNCIPHTNHEIVTQFETILKNMPPTTANDFLLKIKRKLFIKFSKLLHCNFIFTAETTNTLAINLLCNVAMGRGSQVQDDIGLSDIRDDKVRILRPLKDISKEELDYYVKLKQLHYISDCIKNNASLHSVISSFVCDLQENFQATISTVCKTADKIGDGNRTQKKCFLCESDLNTKNLKISALDSINLSRTLSSRKESDFNMESVELEDNIKNKTTVFPLVHKYLCYGCSRNYSEMNPSVQSFLPKHIQMPHL